jgi:predicted DNA-binding transcriptional regulator AlpA
MTHSDDELLTAQEAAAILRLAVSTLVRWRRETRRQKRQIGPYWVELGHRTVAYRRSAVTEFITSREQRADG